MKIDLSILENYLDQGLLHKSPHPTLPISIWNYSPKTQYERLWDEITLMCRGLVIDSSGLIVARSFNKFFNMEEESTLPQEPFEVYEKLDGSLIIVFWYKEELIVASKGSFQSSHSKEAQSILQESDYLCLEKDKTYSFELIVPWNKIVCDYGSQRKLVLLAKFDPFGNEYDIAQYKNFFPLAKKFEFSCLDGIKSKIPINEEGYVVRFKSGKRIKVKGEEYVKLHRLVSSVSSKSIFEMISGGLEEELESAISFLPDELHSWANKVRDKIKKKFVSVFLECETSYREFPSRKESAAYFLTQKHPQVLFSMLDKKDINDMIWKIVWSELKNELQEDN